MYVQCLDNSYVLYEKHFTRSSTKLLNSLLVVLENCDFTIFKIFNLEGRVEICPPLKIENGPVRTKGPVGMA